MDKQVRLAEVLLVSSIILEAFLLLSSCPLPLQVLVGASAVSQSGRYAVGLLDDNELHLTGVEGVLSLR